MLEYIAVAAVAGLILLSLLTTVVCRLYRRLCRGRLLATARALAVVGAMVLAACRLAAIRNWSAALRVQRLIRAQRVLRQRLADGARTGAYLGDIPEMLPRLQAESGRIRTGLCRLSGSATVDGLDLLAAADRHIVVLANLSDAVAAILALPAAGDPLAQEAVDAALGLRLYAAAYVELTGDPTASTAPQRIAGWQTSASRSVISAAR